MKDKGKQLHQYSDSALGESTKTSALLFLWIIQTNLTNTLKFLENFSLKRQICRVEWISIFHPDNLTLFKIKQSKKGDYILKNCLMYKIAW